MHGVIFTELKKYVSAKVGTPAWDQILTAANLPKKLYVPTAHYPDEEALALVGAAAGLTGKPAEVLLEDFGTFIAADLLDMYKSLVKPGWRTLDVIENTESVIHTAVRVRQPNAAPPRLRIKRLGPTEIEIVYASPRKMCAVGKGIVNGLARAYRESVNVSEPTCMTRGDRECRLVVRLTG